MLMSFIECVKYCKSFIFLIKCISQLFGIQTSNNLSHFKSDDIFYTPSSLYWQTGSGGLLNSALVGCTRIISSEPFSPELWCHIIEKYHVTCTFTSPSLMALTLQSPDINKVDLSSLKRYVTGGSFLAQTFHKNMLEKLKNGKVFVIYGMTEAGGDICLSTNSEKAGSVGCVAIDTEIKIVNDDGDSVGPEETGEICLKSKYSFIVRFF